MGATDGAREEEERFIDQIADRYLEDTWSIVEDVVTADHHRVVWASNEETYRRGGKEMYSVILFTPAGADVSHFFVPSRSAAKSIFTSLLDYIRTGR